MRFEANAAARLIIAAGLLLCALACEPARSAPEASNWVSEGSGFACPPAADAERTGESPPQACEKREYFYYTARGRAAARATSLPMRRTQCREAARLTAMAAQPVRRLYDFLERKQVMTIADREWLVTEFSGRITGAGVYRCCPTTGPDGACVTTPKAAALWSTCMCQMYFKLPDGESAVMAALESRR